MSNKSKKVELIPVRPSGVSLFHHGVVQLTANVSGASTVEDLEDHKFWANTANKFQAGTEVRCLADDMSFVAYGICTFAQGSTVKIKILEMHELDAVEETENTGEFEAKLKGPKKWCVIKIDTGEEVKSHIPTQVEALKWITDYVKALAA